MSSSRFSLVDWEVKGVALLQDFSYAACGRDGQVRVNLLLRIADALESNQERIMEANAADVEAARGHIEDALMQRLALKPSKVSQLAAGIRAIAAMDEPIRQVCSHVAYLLITNN